MLFTFGESKISAEEDDKTAIKVLISEVVKLKEYSNELDSELIKVRADKSQNHYSTNTMIEATILVAKEQVESQLVEQRKLLKALNVEFIDNTIELNQSYLGDNSYNWPVEGFDNIGQGFSVYHKGIDINTLEFNPRAINSQDGIVVLAEDKGDGYGNKVIIYHGNNFYTLYAHLDKITVEKGSYIFEGEEVGIVGNTGNSGGKHLHFEIFVNDGSGNNYIDPLEFLRK